MAIIIEVLRILSTDNHGRCVQFALNRNRTSKRHWLRYCSLKPVVGWNKNNIGKVSGHFRISQLKLNHAEKQGHDHCQNSRKRKRADWCHPQESNKC